MYEKFFSLLKEFSVGDENCTLPLCACVDGFSKSGYIASYVWIYLKSHSLMHLEILTGNDVSMEHTDYGGSG